MLQGYLQDTSVRVTLGQNNSIENAEKYHIPVPALVSNNMVIAVHATKNSDDSFWVARVESDKSEAPLSYNLWYYQYNKTHKA